MSFKADIIAKLCHELGVSVAYYSPLGRGMLMSTFASEAVALETSDIRKPWSPRFSEHNAAANVRVAQQFKAPAEKRGCTPLQLALAWLPK